jgi:hypothetical protein
MDYVECLKCGHVSSPNRSTYYIINFVHAYDPAEIKSEVAHVGLELIRDWDGHKKGDWIQVQDRDLFQKTPCSRDRLLDRDWMNPSDRYRVLVGSAYIPITYTGSLPVVPRVVYKITRPDGSVIDPWPSSAMGVHHTHTHQFKYEMYRFYPIMKRVLEHGGCSVADIHHDLNVNINERYTRTGIYSEISGIPNAYIDKLTVES